MTTSYWSDAYGGEAAQTLRDGSSHPLLVAGFRNLALLGFTLLFIALVARAGRNGRYLSVWGATTLGAALAGALGNLVYYTTLGGRGGRFGLSGLVLEGLGYGAQFGCLIGLVSAAIAAAVATSRSTTIT